MKAIREDSHATGCGMLVLLIMMMSAIMTSTTMMMMMMMMIGCRLGSGLWSELAKMIARSV